MVTFPALLVNVASFKAFSGNHTDISAGQKPDRPCGREPQPVCPKQRHQGTGQPRRSHRTGTERRVAAECFEGRNINQQCGQGNDSREGRDTDYLQRGVYQTGERGGGDRQSEGGAGEGAVGGEWGDSLNIPLPEFPLTVCEECLKRAAENGSPFATLNSLQGG